MDKEKMNGRELTEKELEQVSGGKSNEAEMAKVMAEAEAMAKTVEKTVASVAQVAAKAEAEIYTLADGPSKTN